MSYVIRPRLDACGRKVVALVCAALALTLLAGAGDAQASTLINPTFFGQDLYNFPGGTGVCQSGSSCPAPPWGVNAVRLTDWEVSWCNLNPAPGQYNWGPLDTQYLNNPAYANADFLYTFTNPPGFATGSVTQGCQAAGNASVPDVTDWDNFVTALVQHANGRIKYFEIWNEWDYSGFWTGTTAQMVTLAHDAAQIIHQTPGLMVLTPSTSAYDGGCYFQSSCNSSTANTFEGLLQSDPPSTKDFDIVSVHTYPTDSNGGGAWPEVEVSGQYSISDEIRNAQASMQRYGYATTTYPLWSTEGSWGTNSGFPDYGNDNVDHGQRAFVARYDLALLSLGVARAYWYAYSNCAWGTLWMSSSVTACGTAALNPGPTPGGIATNTLENPTNGWLTGATLTAPCSKDSTTGVWSCDITRSGGYIGKILWVDTPSADQNVPTPSGYTTLRKLDGTSEPIPTPQIAVDTEPILIQS